MGGEEEETEKEEDNEEQEEWMTLVVSMPFVMDQVETT